MSIAAITAQPPVALRRASIGLVVAASLLAFALRLNEQSASVQAASPRVGMGMPVSQSTMPASSPGESQ